MTDDIKVGDRVLIPADIRSYEPGAGEPSVGVQFPDGTVIWLSSLVISTYTRLPPEIGVGDEVHWDGDKDFVRHRGDVVHVSGDLAWVHAPLYDAIRPLSDLTLVKKAET